MTSAEEPRDSTHALKCELAAEVLRSSGRLRLRVTGWIMYPTIRPGDTLEMERTERDALSAGDIVLFNRDRRLFAHRICKTDASATVTRGDAMPRDDAAVEEKELLGRVAVITRNGKCIQPSKSLSLPQRAVAGLVRSSDFGARVVVGIHGFLQSK